MSRRFFRKLNVVNATSVSEDIVDWNDEQVWDAEDILWENVSRAYDLPGDNEFWHACMGVLGIGHGRNRYSFLTFIPEGQAFCTDCGMRVTEHDFGEDDYA